MKEIPTPPIIILAPLPALRARVRLTKVASVLLKLGHSLVFLGWERSPEELKSLAWGHTSISEMIILRGGGRSSAFTRMMYPLWLLVVFWNVLLLGRRRTLYCLGWETAFPATIASWFTGSKIIFDDADRFSKVISLPRPLQSALVALERWTSKQVALHIIPSFARYEWKHASMRVLRNTPSRDDLEAAKSTPASHQSSAFVVYVNGWLIDSRGVSIFRDAMNEIGRRKGNIRMLLAGSLNSPEAVELANTSGVTSYGRVCQRDALALYKASDVALTFYDPRIAINRQAEANKWADCVLMETPFIVNSEVETAEEFIKVGAAWAVPYDDCDALVDLLLRLADAPQQVESARIRLAELAAQFRPFDVALEEMFLKYLQLHSVTVFAKNGEC